MDKFKKEKEKNPSTNETGPKVTVLCDREYEEGVIYVKTVIDKNNPEEQTVGQLNLVPNKAINLNIDLVPLVRKRFRAEDEQYLNACEPDIKSYLTKRSLQQALIVPNIETLAPLEIDDEDNKIVTEVDKEPVIAENAREIITETYRKQYNKSSPFKEIVVFLCAINYETGHGGRGNYHPTQGNTCYIFKNGIEQDEDKGHKGFYSTVAHEIGHVLGLDHTFESSLDIRGKENKNAHDRYREYKKYYTTKS
jgi:hypothetical protein